MKIVAFEVSTLMLKDVKRRSFFASLLVFDRGIWAQWWPRNLTKKFTWGIR